MAKETVDVLIVGGKATAAPPLGPALGPKGVNIGKVVADINAKTKDYAGMQVPVKVIINTDDKSYEITIGTPPTSALIKKELNIKKAAGNIGVDITGDLTFDQVMKIARMKDGAVTGKTAKDRVQEILGTCRSMSVNVEGKSAQAVTNAVAAGEYDAKLN